MEPTQKSESPGLSTLSANKVNGVGHKRFPMPENWMDDETAKSVCSVAVMMFVALGRGNACKSAHMRSASLQA